MAEDDPVGDAPDERVRHPRRTVVLGAVILGVGLGSAGIAMRSLADPRKVTPAMTPSGSARVPAPPAAGASAGASPTPTRTPTPTTSPSSTPTDSEPVPVSNAPSVAPSSDVRLFAAGSPWNQAIPAGPAVDPQSRAIAAAVLTSTDLVVNVAIRAYGIPFYTATPATPRVVLRGRGGIGRPIPLDPSWKPNVGGDHKLNVVDPEAGVVYELQGYDRATRSAYWMVVRDLDGSGDGTASEGRRGPTGSGMSQAGGIIRAAEIRRGRIDHALSFITSAPLADRSRYPATSSDGTSRALVGIEEGMRIQLDPSLAVDRIPHITKGERAIALALQRFGAYCVDNGGGNNQALGFYAEQPTAGSGDPYAAAGLPGDWVQLRHIPRSALRVLAASVTRR